MVLLMFSKLLNKRLIFSCNLTYFSAAKPYPLFNTGHRKIWFIFINAENIVVLIHVLSNLMFLFFYSQVNISVSVLRETHAVPKKWRINLVNRVNKI